MNNKKQNQLNILQKDQQNKEIKNELTRIKTIEKLIEKNWFETIRSFGDCIFNGKITLGEADTK